MIEIETESQDFEIGDLATKVWSTVHRRALNAGLGLVFVKNGELVRMGPAGIKTVLKSVPPRKKVSVRIKRATT